MSARATVLTQQSRWAVKRGLETDLKGYVASPDLNLHRPLSASALADFARGSGNELRDGPGRPAKMRATHSSSALVVNVFDYWAQSPERVLSALGLPPGAASVVFEAQFDTGLDGNPPNLDLCVRRVDGRIIGIESKFTEWMVPKAAGKEFFKARYFPDDGKLWAAHGLQGSQQLAQRIHRREQHFRYLDAPQLLKHALGMANSGHPFELFYLYYEADASEADMHRAEIQAFGTAVAGDFPFHVGTYQEVYERIRTLAAECDAAYLAYLDTRYFS
jgi:hypothetical protein